MTKTQHYQLNQWDAGDRVLREDFNGDNQKIDETIHKLDEIVKNRFYFGTYVGDGKYPRTIKLPFTPKIVIQLGFYGNGNVKYGMISILTKDYGFYSRENCGALPNRIIETGILLKEEYAHNKKGETEHYIAIG